jgi:serine/threonine-protein kinase
LAEAHASLASVKFLFDRDWTGAENEFRESIRNNPEYATARQFYSHNLALLGRFDEALEQIRIAQNLRPSPIIDATVSRIYFLARRYTEAIEAAKYAIERYHEFFLGYVHLGIVYRQLGKLPEAIEQLRKAREYGGTQDCGNPAALGELGYALAVAGIKAEAKEIVSHLELMSKRHYVGPINLAKIYMGLGDLKRTFDLLEQTFRDRSAWLLTLKTDPMYDDIRGHPQFQDLLTRVGLP